MTLQRAILKIDADVDGDGTAESGEFHMLGGIEIRPRIRPDFTIGGRGSTVTSILQDVSSGEYGGQRQGIYLDLGAGQHVVEIVFEGWEGATDGSGNPVQWGDTGTTGTATQADATGADPMTQMDVLMKYLIEARIDSTSPATLEYGEYSSSGLYDPLQVVIEGPEFTRSADDGSWFSGQITCITAASLTDTGEETERNDHG